MSKNKKRGLFYAGLAVFIPLMALLVIRLAQGYRPDLDNLNFKASGLLVATSEPDGAQIFIDGKLVSATNDTINLPPGEYEVEIKKDGYTSWKKTLPIEKELVRKTEAYLFPAFPDLRSITFTGVSNPVLSPDNQKVVFTVTGFSEEKDGLWVLDLASLPLGFPREPRQIIQNLPSGRDFTTCEYRWSPDSKQILVTLTTGTIEESFLLEANQLNLETNLVDISPRLTLTSRRWEEEAEAREKAQISKLPDELLEILGNSAKDLLFSPDETKILYTATASASIPEEIIPPLPAANATPESRDLEPGKLYVYDLKEDRNFFIIDEKEIINDSLRVLKWFPTSRHLFYVQEGKITILEYDSTNWVDVYSGPLVYPFACPFPSGTKILILTALGQETPANFYAISLR